MNIYQTMNHYGFQTEFAHPPNLPGPTCQGCGLNGASALPSGSRTYRGPVGALHGTHINRASQAPEYHPVVLGALRGLDGFSMNRLRNTVNDLSCAAEGAAQVGGGFSERDGFDTTATISGEMCSITETRRDNVVDPSTTTAPLVSAPITRTARPNYLLYAIGGAAVAGLAVYLWK